ncbi:MAG: hypothetical protein WD077_09745 [Bacteroidia bacterium]
MKKETLHQLLQNPEKPMNQEESELLRQVIGEYPYFHSARALFTKTLSDRNTINFEKTLKTTAAHSADRSALYHFLYKDKTKQTWNLSTEKSEEDVATTSSLEKAKPAPTPEVENEPTRSNEEEAAAVRENEAENEIKEVIEAKDEEKPVSTFREPEAETAVEPESESPAELNVPEETSAPGETTMAETAAETKTEEDIPVVSETGTDKEKEAEEMTETSDTGPEEFTELPQNTEEQDAEQVEETNLPEPSLQHDSPALQTAEPVAEISTPETKRMEESADVPSEDKENDRSDQEIPEMVVEEPGVVHTEENTVQSRTEVLDTDEDLSEAEESPDSEEVTAAEDTAMQPASVVDESPEDAGRKSFIEWLHYYNDESGAPEIIVENTQKEKSVSPEEKREKYLSFEFKSRPAPADVTEIIDKFIEESPRIKPPKTEFYSPSAMATRSAEEDDELFSETLARINAEQGNLKKAIEMYEKLGKKYPEKFSYFAALIKDLRHKSRN